MAIESLLFYAVYLSQVLLISLYLPSRVLRHVRRLIETFPPSDYPKLYPEPLATIDGKLRVYRNLNTGLLLLGLGLLAGAWLSDYRIAARYGAYPTMVAHSAYSMLQVLPMIVVSFWGLAYFKRIRAAARGRIRTAELKARRLFEFVSPTLLGTAIALQEARPAPDLRGPREADPARRARSAHGKHFLERVHGWFQLA